MIQSLSGILLRNKTEVFIHITAWITHKKTKKKKRISQVTGASQVALVVKNPPANAGRLTRPSLIPGSEGCP